MRRPSNLVWFLGIALFCPVFLLPLLSHAQTSSRGRVNKQGVLSISDNVDLVVLDVAAKYPHGGFATGLRKSDFELYVDGRRCGISQFTSVDTPVAVGLVLDDSGSMRTERPQLVTAGLAFAKESNPKDQFFVLNFNNYVWSGMPKHTPFTDDLQVLRSVLDYGTPEGQTALYDAVADALKWLEHAERDKRTLIVVSDGGDNVSKIRFPELLRLVEASRATIYTVGLVDPENNDLHPSVLKKLASVSGGEYFQPKSTENVVQVFHRIAKEIRNRYTLAFVPDMSADHRTVRTVRVVAQDKGTKLLVRTRSTFSMAPAELKESS